MGRLTKPKEFLEKLGLSDRDYQNKLEYERNEVSLIIKGILEGEFDWVNNDT